MIQQKNAMLLGTALWWRTDFGARNCPYFKTSKTD